MIKQLPTDHTSLESLLVSLSNAFNEASENHTKADQDFKKLKNMEKVLELDILKNSELPQKASVKDKEIAVYTSDRFKKYNKALSDAESLVIDAKGKMKMAETDYETVKCILLKRYGMHG